MPRTRHSDHPNAVWHITQRVNWRVWHLQRAAAYRHLVRAVTAAASEFGVDVLAFVAMSNHFHGVFRSPEEARYREHTQRRCRNRHTRPYPAGHPKAGVIGQCVRQYSLNAANRVLDELDLSGHLWEGRHDRVLISSPRQLIATIAYDHRNPVDQNMVLLAEDYDRSSAGFWVHGRESDIPLLLRGDLPFDLEWAELRRRVLSCHGDGRLSESMAKFRKRRLRMDSIEGARYFAELLDDADLLEAC